MRKKKPFKTTIIRTCLKWVIDRWGRVHMQHIQHHIFIRIFVTWEREAIVCNTFNTTYSSEFLSREREKQLYATHSTPHIHQNFCHVREKQLYATHSTPHIHQNFCHVRERSNCMQHIQHHIFIRIFVTWEREAIVCNTFNTTYSSEFLSREREAIVCNTFNTTYSSEFLSREREKQLYATHSTPHIHQNFCHVRERSNCMQHIQHHTLSRMLCHLTEWSNQLHAIKKTIQNCLTKWYTELCISKKSSHSKPQRSDNHFTEKTMKKPESNELFKTTQSTDFVSLLVVAMLKWNTTQSTDFVSFLVLIETGHVKMKYYTINRLCLIPCTDRDWPC